MFSSPLERGSAPCQTRPASVNAQTIFETATIRGVASSLTGECDDLVAVRPA